jgi:3-oxoacyl-[acyl-carrier-protein] synthase II
MSKRIAITGLGVLSPIGSGTGVFWQSLIAGKIGTGEIKAFDMSAFNVNRGGEVKDFDPASALRVLKPEETGRTSQLAVAAARMALNDAGNSFGGYDADRVGVCMGTTLGNVSIMERFHDMDINGEGYVSPELIGHYPAGYISSAVSAEFGFEGPSMTVPTACAAGNYAISWGMDLIREGMIDAAVVGGSDGISRSCYTLFYRLGAIAPELCQPFNKDRKGMMVSEGAAVLILEEMDAAVRRGATIYAELIGAGNSCDAHHPTAPHPEGVGAVLAMERAMQEAGVEIGDISYISAHGTGTKANDLIESIAIRRLFGELADRIPTSSIKSMLGHTMGAASAIEAVACALAIRHSILPPTMNVAEQDPECIQDIVANKARSQPVEVAMSNSFAFGGNIATIIMKGVTP